MNKKGIFLWALYDFANSFVTIIFFLYFAQWLVVDRGVSDFSYNLIFIGSTALLILTTPVSGILADKLGIRMKLLTITTILMFGCFLTAGLIANFREQLVAGAILMYMLGVYFYQFSLGLYNPMLRDIAPPRLRGFVSGLGESANWLGQIFGLLISLPFVSGAVLLFGNPGRPQAFIPAVGIFFILALPMLLFFKDPVHTNPVPVKLKEEYKNFFVSLKKLLKYPNVGRFLLGYFLFNDALVTAAANFPIYMERVLGISDKLKSFLLIILLVAAVAGSLVGGWIADRIGLKKTLQIVLVCWAVIFPAIAWVHSLPLFTAGIVIIGLLFGSVWTLARAIMTNLSPPNQLNYSFSFYTLAERLGSFVGPISWGLVTLFLLRLGATRYRVALTVMSAFIIIGLLIIKKIPTSTEVKVESLS